MVLSMTAVIKNPPRILIIPTAILLLFLIGWLDYLTSPEFSYSLFYLLPVALMVWFVGIIPGIITAICGTLISFFGDIFGVNRVFYLQSTLPVWSAFTRLGILLVVSYILSILHKTLDKEKELARTDSLTGIPNARLFDEFASIELAKMQRNHLPMTLIYTDLDNFKDVNDQLGHAMGDTLLTAVAQTLRNNLRLYDLVARMGGDEFVILMPETNEDVALSVVERLRTAVSQVAEANHWPITISYGMVTCHQPPASIEDMLKDADSRLYEAKHAGKNQVRFIDSVES